MGWQDLEEERKTLAKRMNSHNEQLASGNQKMKPSNLNSNYSPNQKEQDYGQDYESDAEMKERIMREYYEKIKKEQEEYEASQLRDQGNYGVNEEIDNLEKICNSRTKTLISDNSGISPGNNQRLPYHEEHSQKQEEYPANLIQNQKNGVSQRKSDIFNNDGQGFSVILNL